MLPPIPPMAAKTVAQLPCGEGWSFEPKYDGFMRHEVHVIEGRWKTSPPHRRSDAVKLGAA